ncbi:MAG: hypothetical protein AAF399_13795, partial [Bacteroidota bacterium]
MQRPISTKPRVIKDFEKLDEIIQEQIKLAYPEGFLSHLIKYQNKEGKMVSALPFETDEKSYLVRMSRQEAEILIEEDDDYDEDGNLKNRVKDEYEEKYSELDYMSDYLQEEG